MAWISKKKAWIARGFGILALVSFFSGIDLLQTKMSWLNARDEAISAGDAVRLEAIRKKGRRDVLMGLTCLAGSVAFYIVRVVIGVSDRRKAICKVE